MKKYFKVMAVFVLAVILGFILAISLPALQLLGLDNLVSSLDDFLLAYGPLILIIFTVIYQVLAFGLYFLGKRQVKEDIKEERDIINDSKLSLSMGISTIGYFINYLLFAIAIVSTVKGPQLFPYETIITFLVFMANLVLMVILQKKI